VPDADSTNSGISSLYVTIYREEWHEVLYFFRPIGPRIKKDCNFWLTRSRSMFLIDLEMYLEPCPLS
jgi:hypothetical protein